MAILSLPICLIWQEYYALIPFAIAAIASIATGQLFYRPFRHVGESRMYHALIAVAIAWGIIPLFAAIPFSVIASHFAASDAPLTIREFQDPLNCIFEAFSGFTSAGLSVARKASKLPHSLQWWRSFMQWMGGVGVIVLAISLLEPSSDSEQLYSAEGRSSKIGLTVQSTVRKIWKIYLGYTVGSILLLWLVGMPVWEAINHGMAGISTGGFSIKDDSMGAYSPTIRLAVSAIMTLGAISFPVHYRLWRDRRPSALWGNDQHVALWLLLGVGFGLLVAINAVYQDSIPWLESWFQWVSALGTCGFNSTNINAWSGTAKLLMTIAFVIGGTAGSTVGGLKLSRVTTLYRAILWHFQRLTLKPHQMMRYEIDGEVVTETEASRRVEGAAVLAMLWMAMLLLGLFSLRTVAPPQYTSIDVAFETASALGSVGLSIGITGPELPWLGRLTEILLMWMGRLEIVPVLLFLSSGTQWLLHLPRFISRLSQNTSDRRKKQLANPNFTENGNDRLADG
ncbi:MAG: TrkH family potassium uptake protein [Cyanobacteriota bacterium]|nr:TrkH family potassium uptake protein [Cyanobacteriota bacterium]